jgi:hypothetical protein
MEINQRPTPPNEWLYKQTFVTDPETGETEEVRSDWCTQHMGYIPEDVPATEWYRYFYKECTTAEKEQWEEEHKPEPEPIEPEEAAES